jgi:Holliday junction resolvase-like predicted endonuclease
VGSGSKSKQIGKTGERNAKKLLSSHGCHIAMTEVSGLAGDDVFVKDKNGKWWSVEVKHTKSYKDEYLTQARRQAAERYAAIQAELSGEHGDMYRLLGLDRFAKNNYMLLWHPRGSRVAQDEWFCWYSDNGSIHLAMLDGQKEWSLSE